MCFGVCFTGAARTVVGGGVFAAPEDLERRVTGNPEAAAGLRVGGTVHLQQVRTGSVPAHSELILPHEGGAKQRHRHVTGHPYLCQLDRPLQAVRCFLERWS